MPSREHNPDDSREDWRDDRDEDADFGADPDDHELADEERFSSSTAYCPDCGAEVHDDADVCPSCFSWLNGETSRHPPKAQRRRQQGRGLVVLLLIGSMLFGLACWLVGWATGLLP